jgi:predicted lipoprotein with Yx(FWY)xxD motif
MKRILILVAAAVAVALTVAACGSRASAATGPTTVATKQISGLGAVLVNAAGLPLYANNQDSAAMVRCNGSCTSVWRPLTVATGSPTGTSSASALGVISLSNGMRQVTVNGKPVYTFRFDKPGTVSGNNAMDQFGGERFTWHVVSQGAPASSSGGGQSGGGMPRY